MKVFKEMASLVTNQRLQKIELIDEKQELSKDNLYLQLFKGIAEGKYTTDEDAASDLYQSSSKDKRYQMLKSRLKDRLVNTLFFINHRKIHDSKYQQAVYQCNRNYFCAKLLLTHGARTSAISMAKTTLIQAQKFDLNEIVLLCARMLRHHYSLIGNKTEWERSNQIVIESQKKVRAESRAEYLYETIVSTYARTKAFKPEHAENARECFNQCKELSKEFKSFHLTVLYYRTGMLYYQIIQNYRLLLNLCNNAQEFLRKHPDFYVASREGEIALLKMVCYLYLKDYDNGRKNAEEAQRYYTKGSNNWFILMENYLLLTMHTGKYEHAVEVFEEVTSHPRFTYLSDEKKEAWKIYDAYLNYLFPGQLKSKEFKLMKFLNDIPIFSKDKAGFYPAVLIAQVLFLIEKGDEDQLDRVIESLRIYSTRHLARNKASRTTLFIKMLRQLANFQYNPKKVRVRAHVFLEKLRSTEPGQQAEVDAMEIIPYEEAWSIILNRLEAKSSVPALKIIA
jgi:hypothetical protein